MAPPGVGGRARVVAAQRGWTRAGLRPRPLARDSGRRNWWAGRCCGRSDSRRRNQSRTEVEAIELRQEAGEAAALRKVTRARASRPQPKPPLPRLAQPPPGAYLAAARRRQPDDRDRAIILA